MDRLLEGLKDKESIERNTTVVSGTKRAEMGEERDIVEENEVAKDLFNE